MKTFKELKCQAREAMQGKWGMMAGVTLVYYLILSASSVAFVGPLVIDGPLTLGLVMMFLNISRKNDVEFGDMFKGFNQFVRSFVAYLLMLIFIFLWALLLIIPGIIASLSYAMTFFILADDPSIKAGDAIKKSKEMMQGNKGRLFLLYLSFIGWIILGMLSCGIGMLWIGPYMCATIVNFYEDLKAQAPTAETAPIGDTAPPEGRL